MTDAEKLEYVKTILSDGGEVPSDAKLNAYIQIAGYEILDWMYHLIGGTPEGMSEVPGKYEQVQIYSVVAGYTHAGSEGASDYSENGVKINFVYSDMIDYIHNHVLPYVRVGALV